MLNLFAGDPTGRLFEYDIATREATVIVDQLWYANGVAVAEDGSFVCVVETNGFRVMKHWLRGEKKGRTEELISGLPGFPDGISRSSDGNFWVCLVVPLSPILHSLRLGSLARYAIAHLSLWSRTRPLISKFMRKWGCVLKVSPEGEVLDMLMDPDGSVVSTVSAVTEHNGRLFLGNLGGNFVSVYDLHQAQDQAVPS